MAEQEVIKHTKKVFNILGNKNSSFWHKLKDFVLEIFIIVFAISISIWFHNWSEHKKEQKTAKTFLIGLKGDIQADIIETEDILKTYDEYKLLYTYLNSLDRKNITDKPFTFLLPIFHLVDQEWKVLRFWGNDIKKNLYF